MKYEGLLSIGQDGSHLSFDVQDAIVSFERQATIVDMNTTNAKFPGLAILVPILSKREFTFDWP